MRRLILSAVAATAALATAGLALATLHASGVSATTATFSAAKQRSETRTCTGNGDTYEITRGRYAGTIDFADPNSDLDGPVVLQVRAVLNKTKGVGYVQGWLWTRENDRRGHGSFVGTLDGSGNMDGFFQGRVNRRYAVLLGGVSARFSADAGFTEGRLGNGSVNLPAVLAGRPCTDSKPAGIAVKLVVKGAVAALDSTRITVDPRDGQSAQTCELRTGVSPSLDDVKVGSQVEMRCGLVDGKMTLLKLRKRH